MGRQRLKISKSSSASLPWISQVHYPKPSSPPPSPPLPLPPPLFKPPSRFLSDVAASRLILRHLSPQRALDLFNSLPSQPGFSNDHETYSSILLRLARSPTRHLSAIDALLHWQMSLEPCRFHEPLFVYLMFLFSLSYLHDDILRIFLFIPPLVRAPPSPKAISTCLNLLVESSRFDLVNSLFSYVKNNFRCPLNTCIYNVLIKRLFKIANLDSAFQIF